MSKKNKNLKEKRDESSKSQEIPENFSNKTIKKADSIYLISVSQNFKLKNLNQLLLISYFKDYLINKIVAFEELLSFDLYGKKEYFKILNINKEEKDDSIVYLINSNSKIYIVESEEKEEFKQENLQEKNLIDLAGLDSKISEIFETIKITFQHQEFFSESGLKPVKGILIHGPSGLGKSSLLKIIRQKLSNINFLSIEINKLLSKFVGESEKKIGEIFDEAKKMQPSIILFDDIHVINKKELGQENSFSFLNSLCTEIDNINYNEKVMIIATANQISNVDMALRRSGRLDKEIKLEIPQNKDRLSILSLYLDKLPHQLKTNEIIELNENMNGFTGSDIVSLLRESLLKCLKLKNENEEKPTLFKKDIESCLSEIQPSGLKDLILEIPKLFWKDIGGYDQIKNQVKQVVEWPLKNPEAFDRMGIKPSKGILLYGPPGCSKTMIAKAIATESSLNFIAIKGPELFSKYVGDSEKAIRELFKRARLCSPSVIFFDEIDAIASQRSVNTDVSDRVLCQLLTEMDGVEPLKHVVVIAATNRPDVIDIGLTRPGRFDHLIYVYPPDLNCRREIFKLNIFGNKMPVSKDIEIEEMAIKTEGYSGAEICLICREAGLNALNRDIQSNEIIYEDFKYSLNKVKPRLNKEMIRYYEEFETKMKLI